MLKFLGELDGVKGKLEHKKSEAQKVIQKKMKDLHQLIDKWETRLLDTMAETLDEKIEGIVKQVRVEASKPTFFVFLIGAPLLALPSFSSTYHCIISATLIYSIMSTGILVMTLNLDRKTVETPF